MSLSAPVRRFNPRARAGRDHSPARVPPGPCGFNPRARAGRDDDLAGAQDLNGVFQSTRPRGARHSVDQEVERRAKVSIHAPARGATLPTTPRMFSDVFQSTRPRGARPPAAPRTRPRPSFNPRARAGRDSYGERRFAIRTGFNPRARAGRDRHLEFMDYAWMSFNPRARAGRDELARASSHAAHVSIHAPARGATEAPEGYYPALKVSIHAPARGATCDSCCPR